MNEAALKVIRILNKHGHDAYLVGGCVRNYLMNLEPADYDIATSADVEDVKKLFEWRAIGSGEVHGTVLVLIDGEDHHIEVTSYRDGAVTLEEDLSHRDFTMNAIAYHPDRGIIDIFGGAEDIKNRIIRGIIDSHARFHEDPLRILRALRFSSVFGFGIEHETSSAIHNLRFTLKLVSHERIENELTKIICGHDAERVLTEYRDVISAVIPELESMNASEYSRTVKILAESKDIPVMRWASLLNGIDTASEIMERLRFDNKRKNSVDFLIGHNNVEFPSNKKEIKHYISNFGHDDYVMLLEFRKSCMQGNFDYACELLREVEAEDSCMCIKDLAVNGHDVMSLGLKGREVGRALSILLEAVIDERVKNNREELLEFLKKNSPPN